MEEIVARVVRLSQEMGATAAEATALEGDEFEVKVRMGEIEKLQEAGSKGTGVRVLVGKKTGSAYTSDLTESGLRHMVKSAMELAGIAMEDPDGGLPLEDELGSAAGEMGLYSEGVDGKTTEEKIELARTAEAAALAADARIGNSEGGSCGSSTGMRAFANSLGFLGSYRYSSCSVSVVAVAKENGAMQRDYWYSAARGFEGLEAPEAIGREAARRAVQLLGAKKAQTTKAPVVFEPRTARSLIGHLFSAVAGDSVYRKASFLAGKLGEEIASKAVTIIDDATMPGLFGTSPFDDEGVPSRRTMVVEDGVLRSYLLNTYTARKLGLTTTGNASRHMTGIPGTGHGNLYLKPGTMSPAEIVGGVKSGLFVTELLGSGVNIVNGDYSVGAAGLWIENGVPAWPVHEITISGNLKRMFQDIEAVGNDLEFRTSVASPTVLIREMTISGS
jgi:PmbA protein